MSPWFFGLTASAGCLLLAALALYREASLLGFRVAGGAGYTDNIQVGDFVPFLSRYDHVVYLTESCPASPPILNVLAKTPCNGTTLVILAPTEEPPTLLAVPALSPGYKLVQAAEAKKIADRLNLALSPFYIRLSRGIVDLAEVAREGRIPKRLSVRGGKSGR
jgi:hypothetical protein